MPVYEITICRTTEENGKVEIWASDENYIRDHRREIAEIASEFASFETDDVDDDLCTAKAKETNTPWDEIDEELRFDCPLTEDDVPDEPEYVDPNQLSLNFCGIKD